MCRSSSSPPSGSETAAERLTDDLLVEILSRVPGRSLCRFKCVSKHWLGLINDRTYRRKLPRTLTGFFFSSTTEEQLVHPVLPFTNLSGSRSRTSLTFLPNGRNAFLLDCCNGLLLYDVSSHRGKRRYVVCRAGHEPSRAEFSPSLALARLKRAKLGSARWMNEPSFGGSARFASGSVQPDQLVFVLLCVCTPV